jgi:hypothetical protein
MLRAERLCTSAATLSLTIVRKLDVGLLPTARPLKVVTRYGGRRPCSGCDGRILPSQVEYEFENKRGGATYRFHIGCYGLWEAACRHRGFRRPAGRPRYR